MNERCNPEDGGFDRRVHCTQLPRQSALMAGRRAAVSAADAGARRGSEAGTTAASTGGAADLMAWMLPQCLAGGAADLTVWQPTTSVPC